MRYLEGASRRGPYVGRVTLGQDVLHVTVSGFGKNAATLRWAPSENLGRYLNFTAAFMDRSSR